MLAFATYIPQPLPYLELHAVWLKQALAHQDPPYLHMVLRFIDDKLPAKVGLLLCTQLLIGPSRCWKMAGGKFPLLGPCSVSLLAACVLQCLVPLLAAGVLRWFAPFLAACLLWWFAIRRPGAAGSTFRSWARRQQPILEGWIHTPRATSLAS